jgi:hypothetical protein
VPCAARVSRARPGGPSAGSARRAGRGQAAVRAGLSGRGRLNREAWPPPACSSPIRSFPPCSSLRPSRPPHAFVLHGRAPASPSLQANRHQAMHACLAPTPWDSCSCPSGPNRAPTAPRHYPRRPPPLSAGAPRAGRLQGPNNHPNRAPGAHRPFPYPPRPGSGDTSPEFCSNRAGYRHRGDIARLGFFPGGQLQTKGVCARI